jgi:hypothetical protein
MIWNQDLRTDYTDAVFTGLRKYEQVQNEDGTISFRDVTEYHQKENSFFGANDANQMNAAINQLVKRVAMFTPTMEATAVELEPSQWTAYDGFYAQTVTSLDVQDGDRVDLMSTMDVIAQLENDGVSMLYVENNNGVLTAYSRGGVPSVKLTVPATLWHVDGYLEVESE